MLISYAPLLIGSSVMFRPTGEIAMAAKSRGLLTTINAEDQKLDQNIDNMHAAGGTA